MIELIRKPLQVTGGPPLLIILHRLEYRKEFDVVSAPRGWSIRMSSQLTVPMWVWLTLAANRSELTVSLRQVSFGDTLTNIRVLALPLSAGCSRKVSFEFRYGMCASLDDKAMMTLPRFDSDLLMCLVSVNRSPVAPESFRRSEPARSTM